MADGYKRQLCWENLNERQYVQCQGYYCLEVNDGLFASGVHQLSKESGLAH